MPLKPTTPGVADLSAAFQPAQPILAPTWSPHRPDRAWEKLEGGRR